MIQTFTYKIPFEDNPSDVAARVEAKLARVATTHHRLLHAEIDIYDWHLLVALRIDGHTRWHNAGDARAIITSTTKRAGLDAHRVTLESVQIHDTARDLTSETGRTPRQPKPRGSHKRRRAPAVE